MEKIPQNLRENIKAVSVARNLDASLLETNIYKLFKSYLKGRSSYLVFLDNSRDVKLSIAKLNKSALSSFPINARLKLQRQIVKNLYNTISAGQTFVEHLKEGHKFSEAAHLKIYSIFFRELRNYLIHTDTFSLVSRTEGGVDRNIKNYQTMDKTDFQSFISRKANALMNKVFNNPPTAKPHEAKLFAELLDLNNYLNEHEKLIDFEPLLSEYIHSLIKYYRRWITLLLKKHVKIKEFETFINQAKTVAKVFSTFYTPSRLRCMEIGLVLKRSKFK